MAKKSVVERNKKRISLANKYMERRKELKRIATDKTLPLKEIFAANMELALLPRNSSSTRVSNRCLISGRKKGYYRQFGISRIMVRYLASSGQLPGVIKASW